MEAIIGLRLGFTQADRATVCPVIYIIEKPDGNNGEDMTYALGALFLQRLSLMKSR